MVHKLSRCVIGGRKRLRETEHDGSNKIRSISVDGSGLRRRWKHYNPDAVCGYRKNVSGEIFMPAHSKNVDGSLTTEGELFSYICSATGRAYDLTESVNDLGEN